MKNGYELKLMFWTYWKCNKCPIEQDAVDNEEWPLHCGEMMEMGMKKQFRAVEKEKNKEKDRRKLAELFPQCYETNTNI